MLALNSSYSNLLNKHSEFSRRKQPLNRVHCKFFQVNLISSVNLAGTAVQLCKPRTPCQSQQSSLGVGPTSSWVWPLVSRFLHVRGTSLISTSATTRSSLLLLVAGPFPRACSFNKNRCKRPVGGKQWCKKNKLSPELKGWTSLLFTSLSCWRQNLCRD